jgi:ribonucleoside-triphosphate reductase
MKIWNRVGVAGGHLDFTLAPYVKRSFRKHFIKGMKYIGGFKEEEARAKIFEEIPDIETSIEDKKYKKYNKIYNYAMEELEYEGKQATQGLYHNLNTLESRAGSQLPFTSINTGRDISPEGRLVNKWILQASLDGIGKHHKTPIFPISIFQYKKGVNDKEGTPNYDLKKMAIESLSKRIYPNFVNGDYRGNIEIEDNPDTYMATMGCRTLTGYNQYTDNYDKAGRGNLSPITIILPKLGLDYGTILKTRDSADIEGFFKELDNTLELVKNELIIRTEYMFKQSPKSAPFIYDNTIMKGAEDCKNKDNVEECLKHNTLAIGILGMAETCIAMFGKHHGESVESYEFALKVVRRIYDFCNKATKETKYNFGQYYAPAENLCKTARNTLALYYGEIEGVTSNKFLTNSIHIPVYYQIDAFSKITLEAPFTQYGTSGCITYVELDGVASKNLEGIENIVDYAMDLNIPYLALNIPINNCLSCGSGYQSDEDICPICGSNNIEKLRRVTGYLTLDYRNFNEGKIDEVNKRVKHTLYNPQVKDVLLKAKQELKEMGIIDINEI